MAYCITQDPYSITKSLKVASPANPKISPPRVRPHNTIFLRTQSQLHFATMRSSSSSAPGMKDAPAAAPCGDIRQETAHRHWRPAFFAVVQLEVLGANTGSDRYL